MQFGFKKIGPVDAADLELGDLTLIAGRNNTGKTYIVYTLYGFLRTWHRYVEPDRRTRERNSQPEFLRQLRDLLLDRIGSRASMPRKDLEALRRRLLRHAAGRFSRQGIPQAFSSPANAFAKSSLSVQSAPLAECENRRIPLGRGREITVAYGAKNVRLEVGAAKDDSHAPPAREPIQVLAEIAIPDMPEPFILSAERFGISLFYKELDFTKNRLVEMLQQLGDEKSRRLDMPFLIVDRVASRYAMPVKDNIDYTRSIPELRNRVKIESESLDNEIKELMQGYYTASDGDIRFRSKVRRGRTFDIPLHLASSSARGLSDLYFYLRYMASKQHLLIVDEPESHLDTANQIQFARVLARFVRVGIKVLVTTHSDYLIKEINNLVMLNQLDAEARGRLRRRLGYGRDEGLSPDAVRAYVAEDHGLTRCKVDRHGLEMPVFDKTIDDINRVSNELSAAISQAE